MSESYMVYARECWPDGSATEHRLLALQIGTIVAVDDALEHSAPLATPAEEYRTLLPWHPPRCGAVGAPRTPLRDAVRRLDAELAHHAQQTLGSASAQSEVVSWWRSQAEVLVASAWQEARWRTGAPPDEGTYLAVTEHSIGVGWLAATLVRLSGSLLAPVAGSRLEAAIRAVAVAVRTANDLHEVERERDEGKVQLVFLRALRWKHLYTPAEAEHRAKAELTTDLAQRLVVASALLDPSGWTDSPRLRTALNGMLTAAVTLYSVDTGSASHAGAAVVSHRVS
jgi:Terpene synthase family 2, C-terminal metal binding